MTNPYLRHPAATASAFATLAELAGPGRVVLGMGSGGDLALGPTGAVREQPLQRVTDAVRIARAVLRGEATEGYEPPPHSTSAPDVRIVIGARSQGLNRLASAEADGVFIGGVPLPMVGVTLGWAASVRPIDVALYPNVALRPTRSSSSGRSSSTGCTTARSRPGSRSGSPARRSETWSLALAAGDDGPAALRRSTISGWNSSWCAAPTPASSASVWPRSPGGTRRPASGVAYVGEDLSAVLDPRRWRAPACSGHASGVTACHRPVRCWS